MEESTGYTLSQKAQLQQKADYYAKLYDMRLESKEESKEDKQSEDELEARLKSIRGSLNHATFHNCMAKSTEKYDKKVQEGLPVQIHCDEACVCEKCYQCICANEKSKRNTGPKYEYDGSKCLSLRCIPMIDRTAFQNGLKSYYTRKMSKPVRGTWTSPKDNLSMSLRQTANHIVIGRDSTIGAGHVNDSVASMSTFNPDLYEDMQPRLDSTLSPKKSSSYDLGNRGVSSGQLVLREPSIDDILVSGMSRPDEKECLLKLSEINELLALNELEGLRSMDEAELSTLYSQKAMYHIFLNEAEVAYGLCENSLLLKPSQNYDALYTQGCAAYCQREYDLANASFQEAISIDPKSELAKIACVVTLARLSSRKDREYITDF